MSHVIWQIGANIYGLMNLNQHNEELDEQVNRHEKMEAELWRRWWKIASGWILNGGRASENWSGGRSMA